MKTISIINFINHLKVGIEASQLTFKNYKKGIYYDSNSSEYGLGHAVLIVGYGSEGPGKDYYIV